MPWRMPRRDAVTWSAGRSAARLRWLGRGARRFTSRPGWTCATSPAVLQEFGRLLAADRADTLARFVAVQAKGDARARRFVGVLKELSERSTPGNVLAAGLTVLADADLRRELRGVKQPALVMHGARDRIVPAAAGRRLAVALPDARFRLMRSCAHAPFLSQPARIAQMLRAFFDE